MTADLVSPLFLAAYWMAATKSSGSFMAIVFIELPTEYGLGKIVLQSNANIKAKTAGLSGNAQNRDPDLLNVPYR